MEELIYSIMINECIIQLEENSLGYCLSLANGTQKNIFIYSTLDEPLDMMYVVLNYLELTI